MKKSKRLYMAVVLAAGLLAFSGCPKKTEMNSVQAEPAETKPGEAKERAVPVEPERASGPETKQSAEEVEQSVEQGLKPVYFNFDQPVIRDEERQVIQANAAWLKANPKAKIRIEGNCDERGSKEYNLALGQRRAANARKYLADLGIAEGRVGLISYGKEKPVCTHQTEECMQKNRRDDFIVAESK